MKLSYQNKVRVTWLTVFLMLFWSQIAIAQQAVIFKGQFGKVLPNLGLEMKDNKYIVSNVSNPTISAVSAVPGSLLMSDNGNLYVKQDAGLTTNWVALSSMPSTTTGTPLTFAGYDEIGNLFTIPGWGISTSSGANFARTVVPLTASGSQKVHNFELEVDPQVSTTGTDYANIAFDFHFDRTGSGNDFNGNIRGVQTSLTHEGAGHVGDMAAETLSVTVGDGTDTATASGASGLVINGHVQDNAYAQNFSLLSGQLVANAGTASVGSYSGLVLTANASASNTITPARFAIDGNAGNFSGIENLFNGTIADSYRGYVLSGNITVGDDTILHQTNITGDFFGQTNLWSSGLTGTVSGTYGGTYYNTNLDVTGGHTSLQIQDQGTANNWTGINIAGSMQAQTSAVGLSISMDQVSIANGTTPVALSIGQGAISSSISLPVRSNLGLNQVNLINSQLNVVSGVPVTGTTLIGLSMPSNIFAEDNFSGSILGLGLSATGYVGQVGVAGGKTVESINMNLAGAQTTGTPSGLSGGTVTEFNIYNTPGVFNGGFPLNIGNLYGFKAGANFGAVASRSWGVYIDDPGTENWFAGTVSVNSGLQLNNLTTFLPVIADGNNTLQSSLISLSSMVNSSLPVNRIDPSLGANGQVLTISGGIASWVNSQSGFSDPTTSIGDLIYRNLSNVTARLPIGTTSFVLTVSGGVPQWASIPYPTGYVDPLTTNGDLLTRIAGVTTRLPIGLVSQVLTVSGGLPQWVSVAAGGSFTNPLTTNGDIIVQSGGIAQRLGIGAASSVLSVVNGLPAWTSTPMADWYVQAQILGANIAVASGITTDLTMPTNPTLNLVNASFALQAQIACTDGESPSGATCTGDEGVGININIPNLKSSRAVEVCAGFVHQFAVGTGAGTTSGQATFEIIETAANSTAFTARGGDRIQNFKRLLLSATDSQTYNDPYKVCSIFHYPTGAVGSKTYRLVVQKAAADDAAITANQIMANNVSGRLIMFSVKPI